MTKLPILRCALAAAALAMPLLATPAVAGPHGHGMFLGGPPMGGPEGDPGMFFPMIVRGVGLTDAQHQQLRGIFKAHRDRFRDLFTQLRGAQEAMVAQLLQPQALTMQALDPTLAKVASLREQLVREGAAVALEVRGVLTPEQLAKASDTQRRLEALRAEMKQLLGEPPMPGPDGEQ